MENDDDKTIIRTKETSSVVDGAPAEPRHSENVLPVGTRLGEFEILDLVGEGGFGIVYLAYDHSLERRVALKEYMPAALASHVRTLQVTVKSQHDAETFLTGLRSFINEAKMLAQFDSAALVKVYRFWEANGTAYMVMPYYEGITLRQAVKTNQINLTEDWIKSFLANLLDAVETIHRAKCYHRDIAPDNILLLKNGRPLLLDFGAARRVIGDLAQGLTVILKPGFAPIEQYSDVPGVKQGAWTDVYALAAVVYYLITGKAPQAAVARIVHDEMVPAREAGKGRYSDRLLGVIDHALAVRPEQRIQSIALLRQALDIDEDVPRTLPPAAAGQTRPANRLEEKRAHSSAHAGRAEPSFSAIDPLPAYTNRSTKSYTTKASADNSNKKTVPDKKVIPQRRKRTVLPVAVAGVLATIFLGGAAYLSIQRASSETDNTASATQEQNVIAETIDKRPISPATGADGNRETLPEVAARPNAPPVPDRSTLADKPATVYEEPEAAKPATEALLQKTAPIQQAAISVAPTQVRGVSTLPPPDLPASSASSESEMWNTAKSSAKVEDFNAYLARYPKGRYADAAKSELARQDQAGMAGSTTETPVPAVTTAMRRSTAQRGESLEESAWRVASATDNAGDYESYVSRFPNGRYVGLAKDRLAALRSLQGRSVGSLSTQSDLSDAAKQQHNNAPDKTPLNTGKQASPQALEAKTPEQRTATGNADVQSGKYPGSIEASARQASRDAAAFNSGKKDSSEKSMPSAAVAVTGNESSGTSKPSAANRSQDRSVAPPPDRQFNEKQTSQGKPGSRDPSETISAAMNQPGEEIKVLNLADQTMTGTFSSDPVTGIVSGKGRIVWTNGNRFDGTLVQGVKEGPGKFIWNNGQRYDGHWSRDLPNGKGKLIFANGDRFEGELVDGLPQGQGTMRFKNGDVYRGVWVKGKSHGHGLYTWMNGTSWEGEFKNDQRTENGKLIVSEKALAAARETLFSPQQPDPSSSGANAATTEVK